MAPALPTGTSALEVLRGFSDAQQGTLGPVRGASGRMSSFLPHSSPQGEAVIPVLQMGSGRDGASPLSSSQ